MKPKTKPEIDMEIATLEACKAWAPHYTSFGDDNHALIDLQIESLRGEIDTTAGEFDEMREAERSAVMDAEGWKEGHISESPSSGWDSYKPKPTNRKAK